MSYYCGLFLSCADCKTLSGRLGPNGRRILGSSRASACAPVFDGKSLVITICLSLTMIITTSGILIVHCYHQLYRHATDLDLDSLVLKMIIWILVSLSRSQPGCDKPVLGSVALREISLKGYERSVSSLLTIISTITALRCSLLSVINHY